MKKEIRKLVKLSPMTLLRIMPGDVLVLQTDLLLDKEKS